MSLLLHDFFNLSSASKEALEKRLSISDNYSVNEIDEVSNRSERIFPINFEISNEQTELFRVLAANARVKLHPRNITSHRKYIGPVVVGIKRIMFKLISVIMKDTMNAQEIFNRHTVKTLAKQALNTQPQHF